MNKLFECSIRTENGKIFYCELTENTIKQIRKECLISVHKITKIIN